MPPISGVSRPSNGRRVGISVVGEVETLLAKKLVRSGADVVVTHVKQERVDNLGNFVPLRPSPYSHLPGRAREGARETRPLAGTNFAV